MATIPPLSDPALKALAWLLDLAAQQAGFTVRGLPGWASADEIESGVRGWGTAELMRSQAKRGRVHECDVRAPGERRARYVYRISQRGLDEIARTLGLSSSRVGDPQAGEEPSILLRESTQHAIAGLRAALDSPGRPQREWVPGEVGWRSSRELTATMAKEDEAQGSPRYRWFNSEDLRWLVRLGFVEERTVHRTRVYRLQPAGAALNALEWREPKHV